MGAKRHEMRSPEDRARRQAATAAQPKCGCGNVLGRDNESGLCGACTPDPESYIDVVFDGPPGHESGRFVEVEDSDGRSISFGEWLQRPDGYWALRFPRVAP